MQVNALGLVTIINAGSLAINGQGGTDHMTYTVPSGGFGINHLEYDPGATPDAGTIIGRRGGLAAFTPVSFSGLGALGTVIFADASGGRPDTLDFEGTASTDIFSVSSAAGGTVRSQSKPVSSPRSSCRSRRLIS